MNDLATEITNLPGFWALLTASPTLFPDLAKLALVGGSATLLLIIPYVALRRRGLVALSLHRNRSGAALAADYILVAMPFVVFTALILQVAWLMRETLVVHFAAFAAARSAQVQVCPAIPEGPNAAALQLRGILCNGNAYQARVETAARFALVSAAPPWDVPCLGSCIAPDSAVRAIAEETETADQADAMRSQARYAFDPQNVTVRIEPDIGFTLISGLALKKQLGLRVPQRVTVTFRHHVITVVGPLLGTRRSDGYYYRETVAEVVI